MTALDTPSGDLLHSIMEGTEPFAIIRHEEHLDEVMILRGTLGTTRELTGIPREQSDAFDADGSTVNTVSMIPYAQIRERGFTTVDDGFPIQYLCVSSITRISIRSLLLQLPQENIRLKNGVQFDKSDGEYAQLVGRIQDDEIGNGEGANFVVPRTAVADIENFNRSKALSIYRELLLKEFGAYMTFIFSNGEEYFIGASPERHLVVKDGTVGMTPISGTYRKDNGTIDREALLRFIEDSKESGELYMVLDEEGKMLPRMCPQGGKASGPYLREMANLLHTEYRLEGKHDGRDILDLFRTSMYAPTVVGSPVENAARIVKKYDSTDREYYSGAIVLLGTDLHGNEFLDSAITIRTMSIDASGHARVKAGSTIVHDSVPDSETKETAAKAAGALSALTTKASQNPGPQLPSIMDDELAMALANRNASLSPYLFQNFDGVDLSVEGIVGKRITVVANDDDFSYTLGHMCMRMGASVTVVSSMEYSSGPDDADLVIVGPGTGDPNNMNDPKMRKLAAILIDLDHQKRSFAAVCLGHQLVSKMHGLSVEKKINPTQGVCKDIELFGKQVRVGFYNTFVAHHQNRSGIEFSYDADSNEVHAMRGKHFVSFQFHPESVLTREGFEILKDELVRLLSSDIQPAPHP